MNKLQNETQNQRPNTSLMAIWSLAFFIAGSFLCLMIEQTIDLFHNFTQTQEMGALPGPICLLVSVILGLVALVRIRRRKGFLEGQGLALTGVLGSIVVLSLLILFFATLDYQMRAKAEGHVTVACATNLYALGKTIEGYANYFDGEYPTTEKWCDLLVEGNYASKKMFICGGAPRQDDNGKCHYAMNPNCEPNSPPDMVLLFETKGGWNQFGGPEILTTENHGGKGCNVLFNDGSVRFVRTKELVKLKWKIDKEENDQGNQSGNK